MYSNALFEYMLHVCLVPVGVRRRHQIPGNWVTDGCEPPRACWEGIWILWKSCKYSESWDPLQPSFYVCKWVSHFAVTSEVTSLHSCCLSFQAPVHLRNCYKEFPHIPWGREGNLKNLNVILRWLCLGFQKEMLPRRKEDQADRQPTPSGPGDILVLHSVS